jgi:hypothetical protein
MLFRILGFGLVFVMAASATLALAVTDPEPNPFATVQAAETLAEGKVSAVSDTDLTVRDAGGTEYSGQWEAVVRYRSGGGPAQIHEFAVGDSVRFLADASGTLLAVQDADLLLCDQTFYGTVRAVERGTFTLETVAGRTYPVALGEGVRFYDTAGKLIFGYTPRVDDAVRVHGVFNANLQKVFLDTFEAKITLLTAEDLAAQKAAIAEVSASAAEADLTAAAEFQDVPSDYSYRRAVGFVRREGIVNGYDDGTYRAAATVNRAEFAKILVLTSFPDAVETELTEPCFPDVALDAWYAPYVCAAKQQGIIGGYPDGTYRPASPVNLAEALKITVGSFGWTVENPAQTEEWYQPYIRRTAALRVLPTELTQPAAELTRGQLAELIMRSLKHQRGELPDYLGD